MMEGRTELSRLPSPTPGCFFFFYQEVRLLNSMVLIDVASFEEGCFAGKLCLKNWELPAAAQLAGQPQPGDLVVQLLLHPSPLAVPCSPSSVAGCVPRYLVLRVAAEQGQKSAQTLRYPMPLSAAFWYVEESAGACHCPKFLWLF